MPFINFETTTPTKALHSSKKKPINIEREKPEYCCSLTGSEARFEVRPGNLPGVDDPLGAPVAHDERIKSGRENMGETTGTGAVIKRLFQRRKTFESEPKKTTQEDKDQPNTNISSYLECNPDNTTPLERIHPSIPYTLAYYHLRWVRGATSRAEQRARAAELSCFGAGVGRPGLKFWAVPRWHNDTFFVQQLVQFTLTPKRRYPVPGREFGGMAWPTDKKWSFKPCLHIKHQFLGCRFTKTHGRSEVIKAKYRTTGMRRISATDETEWTSAEGTTSTDWNCRYCCTDSSVTIGMVDGEVLVSIHVFRNLGSAHTPFDPNWLAAQQREASMRGRTNEARAGLTRQAVLEAAEHSKEHDLILPEGQLSYLQNSYNTFNPCYPH
ncbi:hypothetical protein GGS23DRAFT_463567 [Durotheca rogersii]|uniref:uncharacterized protein n=1 Tax=Durotheca rogersii TaxID=419775 RepID=UPI00221EECF2|nr:uncharacterized protein GGS23DRAFT_463567 [Durotheca rogersii]KAI5864786.1 hypothetical protein GGS23DRAFT_463567 [Durotheca rogersii]